MPVGAYVMIRHAKFGRGQEVTAELECASMFMTREQKDKVGPYSYNWAHSPAAAWQSIADGVADSLVPEPAPHTREDVTPGRQDRTRVVKGKSVSVRVALVGRRRRQHKRTQ